MAVEVWLLRHGDAVAHGEKPDFQRELTEKGEAQSRLAGDALARLGIAPAACYTSPKVRARDTARLACEPLGVEPTEVGSIAGGFDGADLRELLSAHGAGEAVLLVGHEPDFSQLVHDLTGARVEFKKGGLAAVRVGGGSGELLTLLRPRELAALRGE
jgi:phosphohistidine phosphatase